ncbi:MAG: hypothetical protein ACTSUB_00660 [Candidatus Thorarchaeota archaeon]
MSRNNLGIASVTNNVIGTCPCLGFVDGVPVCLNGGSLEEVELFNIHPDLLESLSNEDSEITENALPVCFGCVKVDDDGFIRCTAQDTQVTIRNHEITLTELEAAMETFPKDKYSSDQDICNECLYKVLISLVL